MAVMLQVNFEYSTISPSVHAANNSRDRALPLLEVQGLLSSMIV